MVIPEYTKKRDGVANIDPKVNEPYEPIPRRVPRDKLIEKCRSTYSSIKIDELEEKDENFYQDEFSW